MPKPKQVRRLRTGQTFSQSQLIEPLALRVPAAAAMIDVSENTLWTLIRTGEVRVSRHGNLTLVWTDSIRDYLQRHADRPPDIRGPRKYRDERAAAALITQRKTEGGRNNTDAGDGDAE